MRVLSQHLFKTATALLFLLFVMAAAPSISAKTVNISLVLISDIYEMKESRGRGGFARLASAIKAERARNRNVIVAHAGDTISPSLMSGFDKGAHIIDLTNRLDLDIFVPGNHEYDFGKTVFLKRMGEARFTLLAANLRNAEGQRLPGFADTKIFEFDGVKIGVMGLTAENSVEKSDPGDLRFASSLETAKRVAAELRKQGADIVVAVAHAGRRTDFRLIRSGVLDVLLSGDDHDLLMHYNGRTATIEAKAEGEYVVAIDLQVDVTKKAGKRRVRWWPRFRIVDTADVAPDKAVAARIAEYQKALSSELDVAIGKSTTELDSRYISVRTKETAIGNLITDAMRAATGADIAIFNGGGIRGNKTYPAGHTLLRRDILTELPFRNINMVLEMKGSDILEVLENGLWFAGKPRGRFLQVSGLKLLADKSKRPGTKILSVEIGGKPLDRQALYRVATNDFLARGAEGFTAFTRGKVLIGKVDGNLIANAVMAHIRKQGTIAPKPEGRIILK